MKERVRPASDVSAATRAWQDPTSTRNQGFVINKSRAGPQENNTNAASMRHEGACGTQEPTDGGRCTPLTIPGQYWPATTRSEHPGRSTRATSRALAPNGYQSWIVLFMSRGRFFPYPATAVWPCRPPSQ